MLSSNAADESQCREMNDFLHNLVEAIIKICRYTEVGNPLILREIVPCLHHLLTSSSLAKPLI